MVVQLLQPAWLWGLLGLLIPIAIHLLHKRSRKVLLVGSLQPFMGGAPVQARRLRPNELWLLLLRCLLLALFVLLLTRPVWVGREQPEQRFVFIAPELAPQLNGDSLRQLGWEPRLLQPGLPMPDTISDGEQEHYKYWDVFKEIEQEQGVGDTVWLLFEPRLPYFYGERPTLTKIFVPLPLPAQAQKYSLQTALAQPAEELLLQWWAQKQGAWRLQEKRVPLADSAEAMQDFANALHVRYPDTLRVNLHSSSAYAQEQEHWQRALQLADSLLPGTVIRINTLPATKGGADADVVVWLAEEAYPAAHTLSPNATLFQLMPAKKSGWFSSVDGQQRLISIGQTITQQLHNRQALAAFLPQLIEALPLPQPAVPPLVLPEAVWQPLPGAAAAQVAHHGEALHHWLLLLLLLVFLIERWLSLRK